MLERIFVEIIAPEWGFWLTKHSAFAYNIPKFFVDPSRRECVPAALSVKEDKK